MSFVLIHGGDQSKTVWQAVEGLLKKAGYRVLCPSMSSVKKATLTQNSTEVLEQIKAEKIGQPILVGHSYGAYVATAVANQLKKQVTGLVYLDSLIPENEQSLFGALKSHGIDYRSFDLTEDPACMEPIHFEKSVLDQIPTFYVYCQNSEFKAVTEQSFVKASQNPAWQSFALQATHNCMQTKPKEVATLLMGIAQSLQTEPLHNLSLFKTLSLLTRKLKPGKTYSDFKKAWLPPVDSEHTMFQKYWGIQEGFALHAQSIEDPTLIYTVAFIADRVEKMTFSPARKPRD